MGSVSHEFLPNCSTFTATRMRYIRTMCRVVAKNDHVCVYVRSVSGTERFHTYPALFLHNPRRELNFIASRHRTTALMIWLFVFSTQHAALMQQLKGYKIQAAQ